MEAGKKAATRILQLQKRVSDSLSTEPRTADQIAQSLGEDAEDVFHILTHLAANDRAQRMQSTNAGDDSFTGRRSSQ